VEAEALGKINHDDEFKRGDFKKASPTKPSGPSKGGDDGFAIRRSDKPRATEEEKKGPPTFTRGPPRNKDPEPSDSGFSRGNFAAKKSIDESAKKKTSAPSSGGDSGFGFRNSNAPRTKKK